MAEKNAPESPDMPDLHRQGARQKDIYYENEFERSFIDDDFKMDLNRMNIDDHRNNKDQYSHYSRSGSLDRDITRLGSPIDPPRPRSPVHATTLRKSKSLPKFKIAAFYPTDVELWFTQLETQFDLHGILDDEERYSLTCAALSGEVASDVRDILLQPPLHHKYENLKDILVERRGLTTSERVNKVITGEKLGEDTPSRFLRRLRKTAGIGTSAVVGKEVLRQTFISQMPAAVRVHLATTPECTTLEDLAKLADRAVAAGGDETFAPVAAVKIQSESADSNLLELLEKIANRVELLESATNHSPTKLIQSDKSFKRKQFPQNVHVKPFHPTQKVDNQGGYSGTGSRHQTFANQSNRAGYNNVNTFTAPHNQSHRQNNSAAGSRQLNKETQVCYYHQTYGDKARRCRDPCHYAHLN